MEKYCGQKKNGYTVSFGPLVGSYISSGIGTYELIFIDPEEIFSNEAIDDILINQDYNLAVISESVGNPNANLHTIKGLYGSSKKIAMIWHDAVDIPLGSDIKSEYRWWEYAEYCPQIFFDHGVGEIYRNVFAMMVPQDETIFNTTNTSDEYDIGFPGSAISTVERPKIINTLISHGYNLKYGGGRGDHQGNLSNEDYADILKKSKICLHMCMRHPGVFQRKCRTSEIAACGKFMLANWDEDFRNKGWSMLEENKEYVVFNEGSLLSKIDYYLDHTIERKEISRNLYNKYLEKYSAYHFWSNVCNICGVK
jgi:hypothetical protein